MASLQWYIVFVTSVVLPANSAPQLCEHGCEHGSCSKGVCICEHPWVGHSCSFSLEEDVPEQMELLQTSKFSPSLMDLAEDCDMPFCVASSLRPHPHGHETCDLFPIPQNIRKHMNMVHTTTTCLELFVVFSVADEEGNLR